MQKHTAGLRTLLHWLPRSSKITVTGNSILYRQPVIIKLAHYPAVLVHLLLKQNALEERCLTIHITLNHHLWNQEGRKIYLLLTVFPEVCSANVVLTEKGFLQVPSLRGCYGLEPRPQKKLMCILALTSVCFDFTATVWVLSVHAND